MGLIKYLGNLDLEKDLVHQLMFGGICIGAVMLSTALSPALYNIVHREDSQTNTRIIKQIENNYNPHPQNSDFFKLSKN